MTSSTQLNFIDEELDELLLSCSDSFEQQPTKRPKLDESIDCPSSSSKARIFAAPKTEQEIQQARLGAIPKKTQSDIKHCVGMWDEWRYHRLINFQDNIPGTTELSWPDCLAGLCWRFERKW